MKQLAIRNARGMATKFVPTQVIRIRSLMYDQLLRVFDQIRLHQSHNMLPLSLIDVKVKEYGGRPRTINILKAVMVSPEYFNALMLANPLVAPLVEPQTVVDDFLMPGDRFNRALAEVVPRTVSAVTTYPVLRIETLHDQPKHITNTYQGIQAYVMHPALATILALPLPPI